MRNELTKPDGGPLDDLAGRINQAHQQAQQAASDAVQHAVQAGKLLAEAKAQVEHGQWLPWIAANFKGSARTAMHLASKLNALPNAQRVARLPLRQVVDALAGNFPRPRLSGGYWYGAFCSDGICSIMPTNDGHYFVFICRFDGDRPKVVEQRLQQRHVDGERAIDVLLRIAGFKASEPWEKLPRQADATWLYGDSETDREVRLAAAAIMLSKRKGGAS
jgi:hypothetical protein